MNMSIAFHQSQHGQRRRRAIFLQGPVGPFFSTLQETLDRAGWLTVKINFNGGDLLFQGTGRKLSFTDRLASWPRWFKGFLQNFQPDVILLFGDQRPIHRAARAIARAAGVQVICFEEGYLRPNYITMEMGGNNAASALRLWRGDEPTVEATPPAIMPTNGFSPMARSAVWYFTAMHAGVLRFPHYRHHRRRGFVLESVMWARNALRKCLRRYENLFLIQSIVERLDGQYFVVALQVHDDLQLRRHGCRWTIEGLIETVIGSFAREAHPTHNLVFKGHPLDRGHSSARELVRELAALHDIKDRVHFIDDGSLGLLTRHSCGMITVNSTSAMVAFAHGKPVLALGDSFYEPLTVNGADRADHTLSRFWRAAPLPEPERWEAFRAHIVATSQVNGSFYIENEIDQTCVRVLARLEAMLEEQPAVQQNVIPLVYREQTNDDHEPVDNVVWRGTEDGVWRR